MVADAPAWVDFILLVGAVSAAVTGVILLALRLGQGVQWISKVHQSAILEPALQKIEELSREIRHIKDELTSTNNGSISERVNYISREVDDIKREIRDNQKWAYEQHALLEQALLDNGINIGLADPIRKRQ